MSRQNWPNEAAGREDFASANGAYVQVSCFGRSEGARLGVAYHRGLAILHTECGIGRGP